MSKEIYYSHKLIDAIAKFLGMVAPAPSQPASFPVITQAQVDKARTVIENSKPPKPVPFSGMPGYSERGAPEAWDTAMGEVYGYRWWYLGLPPESVGYTPFSFKPPTPSIAGKQQRVLYGANNQPWRDGRMEAICTKPPTVFTMVRPPVTHEPPETRGDGCGCGFWAYFDKALGGHTVMPSMAGKLPVLYSFAAAIPVFGVVKGTGRVIVGDKGFRSQYAQIMGLCLPDIAVRQLQWWMMRPKGLDADPWWGDVTGEPEKEQCSVQEHATRISEIEGILDSAYPSAKLFSSQELLTRYFPPDANYA